MRYLRVLPWLLIPIVLGFAAFEHRTGVLQREWATLTRTMPVYDGPSEVSTQVVEVGDVAVARLTIANRCGGELLIDGVQSSCACSGLERIVDEQYSRLEELRLGPGESALIAVRSRVTDASEKGQKHVNRFRTSDPTQPDASITVIVPPVSRGITVAPAGLTFGAVRVGSTVREVFRIYVPAEQRRKVIRVASSDPRVAVRMLPQRDGLDEFGRGVLIGEVEATVGTSEPGRVSGTVTILVDGPGHDPSPIAVTGRVLSPIELAPQTLSLPVASSQGPINEATCVFRSTNGRGFDLQVEQLPPGVDVEIQQPADEDHTIRMVKVRLKSNKREWPSERSRLMIGFVARQAEGETRLFLPVQLNSNLK